MGRNIEVKCDFCMLYMRKDNFLRHLKIHKNVPKMYLTCTSSDS